MSLAAGTRLGPYEIVSFIGAGGMGEVYKASDTRLDRTVAIKVLPDHVSCDPDRRARFEREAKSIAGLTHPNICTLHDVGEQAGSMFLVMELLDGETLADRLKKGRLAIQQALQYAIEIAEALVAAHRHSIVHRDLKPSNIMLTKSGLKLLDFGLAKEQGAGAVNVLATPVRRLSPRRSPGKARSSGRCSTFHPSRWEAAGNLVRDVLQRKCAFVALCSPL
jgi:serine/threonine protein kinase